MKKICFFIIIHVFNLWLASPLCFAAEEELVDEGWRLHKELKIFFSDVTMDFSGEHYEMAHILLPPPQPQSSGENSTKEEKKVRCLMRFTPLINTEKGIERRETIRLTQEIFEHAPCNQSKLPFNEIGFLSGMYNSGKRNIEHGLLKIEPGYLSLIPQYQCNNYISNSFAVRLVQRTYMNPKRLNDSIKSRYPDNTPICFERGNYKKIYEANDVTKRNIKELIQSSEKMIEDITCFIMDGDLESVSSCVSSNEKKFIDFSANTKMLSYVCAEQAALDFLTSKKVQEYLRKLVCLDSLYGVVINFHCSHMPCCSCATALAAEIQDNGVFKVIFGEKVKIYLMCSAQYWYDRKNDMINYNETKYLSELNGLAYPIVPLKFDVAQRAFNIDTDLYDTKLANAKEDISSKKDEDIDITSIFDDEDE